MHCTISTERPIYVLSRHMECCRRRELVSRYIECREGAKSAGFGVGVLRALVLELAVSTIVEARAMPT